ncbi:molybdopterin molybdotransferase MoeA [Planctomycetes bacterium K23_9]|uniref:Molybdopterin molybdenumtransferase n=1 Tax=Stieleria marina TaxID=1930275 RepID=A0A517NN21_9BACT|nr:Molybdopterin molybdenumtransferase [Planctomycetes bacterium K23_9]
MKNPAEAIRELANQLAVVKARLNADDCTGRVLADDVVADRDSPAADVSAMDGYAIRLADLSDQNTVAVTGEAAAGEKPPSMQSDGVVRIFTGAIVPDQCEAVVKREDTEESDGSIRFRQSAMQTQAGDNIRRAGENAKGGSTVLSAGVRITAAHRATMANFGADRVSVFAPVRVTVITTGDEVGKFDDAAPQPWQLRNSNQSSIASLLSQPAWIKHVASVHAVDDREQLAQTLTTALTDSDAVILTGGVSMGDYDYVPEIVRQVGGEVVFHGLPVRPGKPILGAATADGKLIVGLPGNPVSATIGCHRFAMPLLAKMSGQKNWRSNCPVVHLSNAGSKTIPLHWMRLVRLIDHGVAEPVQSLGSGDLVSLGQSTGYVELPPGETGNGPWPYYAWS